MTRAFLDDQGVPVFWKFKFKFPLQVPIPYSRRALRARRSENPPRGAPRAAPPRLSLISPLNPAYK